MKTKSLKKIILALALTCPCMEKTSQKSYAMDQNIEKNSENSMEIEPENDPLGFLAEEGQDYSSEKHIKNQVQNDTNARQNPYSAQKIPVELENSKEGSQQNQENVFLPNEGKIDAGNHNKAEDGNQIEIENPPIDLKPSQNTEQSNNMEFILDPSESQYENNIKNQVQNDTNAKQNTYLTQNNQLAQNIDINKQAKEYASAIKNNKIQTENIIKSSPKYFQKHLRMIVKHLKNSNSHSDIDPKTLQIYINKLSSRLNDFVTTDDNFKNTRENQKNASKAYIAESLNPKKQTQTIDLNTHLDDLDMITSRIARQVKKSKKKRFRSKHKRLFYSQKSSHYKDK